MLRQSIATPAIVLRRAVFGEADLVVTLLGLQTGRVSALARGARKSSRRFSGGLGMGMRGDAMLRERPGAELMSLESFDAQGDRLGLSSEISKTAHAAYAVELCDKLCPPRQSEKSIFDWLDEFLLRLSAGTATADRLRVFELGLLRRLGLGPALDRCTVCGREDLEAENVRWHPAGGGVVCRRCAHGGDLMSASIRQALARFGRASLADADSMRLDREVSSGCRQAMLALLREHVRGPLRSLDFIEKMGSGMSGSR
jgi:DNA repair protein RecO (recombination protein O)